MNLLERYTQEEGYTEIIAESDKRMKYIEFGILRLEEGATFKEETNDKEVALIILSGKCSVKGKNFEFKDIGERSSVFTGKACSVYLPCHTSYEVIGSKRTVEIAVCKAPSDLESKVELITPDKVVHKPLGRLSWERDAYFIIDSRVKAKNLFIGETILPPGHWTFPPHRHDFDNLPEEANMEEIYFFKVKPSQGFGIQKIYTDDRSIDETYTIRNNDIALFPKGYHPVVVSPGDSLYILWIMAGEKRLFLSRPDPRYKSI